MRANNLMPIIQGGMGIGVSSWELAREVALAGQIGTVSGTCTEIVFARLLQHGDPGGHIRRAFDHFPSPEVAERVYRKYFVRNGISFGEKFKQVPMFSLSPPQELTELTVCANFAQVWLAKEGHTSPIAVNFLEKVQLPHLFALYGAMLAGVDMVVVGAGLPVQFPGIIENLARGERTSYRVLFANDPSKEVHVSFDPRCVMGEDLAPLGQPDFLAIISLPLAGKIILDRTGGKVDGFIVEGSCAGGHNAPPRGELVLTACGEPVYGERDRPDFEKIRALGRPFWTAGGWASPEGLREAQALGAIGIQAGTIFAGCASSWFQQELKETFLSLAARNELYVRTSARVSPTGFPFQVAQVPGTFSDSFLYEARPRICDLGYLRELARLADGSLVLRCSAEPIDAYVRKGGKIEDTQGRGCLCNSLLSAIGLGQWRGCYREPPLITLGKEIPSFMKKRGAPYTAREVIEHLLGESMAG